MTSFQAAESLIDDLICSLLAGGRQRKVTKKKKSWKMEIDLPPPTRTMQPFGLRHNQRIEEP
jgi:hypothetical protein